MDHEKIKLFLNQKNKEQKNKEKILKEDLKEKSEKSQEFQNSQEKKFLEKSSKNTEKIQKSENPVKTQEEIYQFNYQPFDPEKELKKILKLPYPEKKEALKNYKKELLVQKLKISNLQRELEEEIKKNPDEGFQYYFQIVLNKAKDLKLSQKQLLLFKNVLKKYERHHKNIELALKKYKDPKDFFKACFGKGPVGKVEIAKSPVMIYLRCHNLEDFTYIYLRKYLKQEEQIKKTKKLEKIYGFVVKDVLLKDLENSIAVENTALLNKEFQSKYISNYRLITFKHEEQHIIDSLLGKTSAPSLKKFKNIKRIIKNQISTFVLFPIQVKNISILLPLYNLPNLSEKEILEKIHKKEFSKWLDEAVAKKYLDSFRKFLEKRAKSEILAYYKSQSITYLKGIQNVILKKDPKGYNYFSLKNKKKLFQVLIKSFPLVDRKEIARYIYQTEKKFEKNTKEALMAAISLLKITDLKMERVVNILFTEPLSQWKKVAKRIEESIKK